MASNTNNAKTDTPLEAEVEPPAAVATEDHEEQPSMESLAQLLRRTIQTGTPLYNQGHPARCLQLYTQAARDSLDASEELRQSETGKLLQAALEQAYRPDTDPAQGAWSLRRCFDEILDAAEEQEFGQDENENNPSVASTSSWQDEPTQNTTVDEKAQSLADTAYILRSGVVVTDYVLDNDQKVKDTFPASAAVEQLTRLGLARGRDQAAQKCDMLRMAGLMARVDLDGDGTTPSTDHDIAFRDGTQLYRFPTDAELEQSLRMEVPPPNDDPNDDDEQQAAVLRRAVQLTLESTQDDQRALLKAFPSSRRLSLVMGSSISSRRSVLAQEEHQQGVALVALLNAVEPHLKIENRK